MFMRKIVIVVFGVFFTWISCDKATKDNNKSVFNGFVVPLHFPQPKYAFENNPITEEKFLLGKKLFYDPILSVNNTISCGNCHIQTSAFTQHGHSVSHGVEDRLGKRNSAPIMNLAWYSSYMWDGGVVDLDLQPIVPITSHEEMAESMPNILSKINSNATYKSLFKQAYKIDEIGAVHILKSLSQFMLMCVSATAKYDSVMQGWTNFNDLEQKGYEIFQTKCNSCHSEPLFTDMSYRNIGLMPSRVDDKGRFHITINIDDAYKFRVPSLRNLKYTAPYMHDGRYLTLNAVLEHYNSNIFDMPNIDAQFRSSGSKLGIALSDKEKEALLTFLATLNDVGFIKNKLLAE
jgi:cytochrome c peroxidase